ncbi:hypothetical protein GGX14DRAFT_403604 [Mycena pura]|uniref:Uncharacterized protein n=1 Tax=Mycena pura TaxID=153505 RepID=A0AAD6UWH2_9AGAR|nr:hypothetical protein GGX14DRAFT_403604 [Mycena pura]
MLSHPRWGSQKFCVIMWLVQAHGVSALVAQARCTNSSGMSPPSTCVRALNPPRFFAESPLCPQGLDGYVAKQMKISKLGKVCFVLVPDSLLISFLSTPPSPPPASSPGRRFRPPVCLIAPPAAALCLSAAPARPPIRVALPMRLNVDPGRSHSLRLMGFDYLAAPSCACAQYCPAIVHIGAPLAAPSRLEQLRSSGMHEAHRACTVAGTLLRATCLRRHATGRLCSCRTQRRRRDWDQAGMRAREIIPYNARQSPHCGVDALPTWDEDAAWTWPGQSEAAASASRLPL